MTGGPSILSKYKENFAEIVSNRNIIRSLVVKNLVGHYKNSVLGFGWHFITPILMMVIYYVIFSTIRSNSIDNFWIFLAAGLFPFNFMMSNLAGGASIIISNGGLIKKIYFPREIFVISQIISTFVVLVIGYSVVLFLIVISGYSLDLMSLCLLPLVLALIVVFVYGYALFFSAITVYLRDVQYFLNSITMVFYCATPMYFVASDAHGILSSIVWMNPFTYYIESLHSILYYGEIPDFNILLTCLFISVASLIIGSIVFSKLKINFAEKL